MAATSIAPSEQEMFQPLESGDNLGALEFLRRYEAMPDVKKAELIAGTVFMSSPVRAMHAVPDTLIQTWIGLYALRTPGTQAAGNATVRLGPKNVPQPDSLLRVLQEYGGKTHLDPDGYIAGPPELIVEVAASSVAIDLHAKLRAYRRAGVQEYLVWRTQERRFDWWVLDRNEYRSNAPTSDGLFRSARFPGLALAVEALLNNDWVKVVDVLQTSLQQDPAHAAFVAQLAAKARK